MDTLPAPGSRPMPGIQRDALLHVGAMLLGLHARARRDGRSHDYLQALVDAAVAVTESAAAVGPAGRAAARRGKPGGGNANGTDGQRDGMR
jgi:hypothetical protein